MSSAARATRCFHCGYDMRGNPGKTCSECGKTKPISIEIQDPEQYHHARALLEHHKLLLHVDQPGGSLGSVGVMYGVSRSAWLWIDANDAERVDELLDEIGINANIDVKPIVDRSEPICPKCNAPLDPLGRAECEQCSTAFQWIDIDDQEIDLTGESCRQCGYQLDGLTSGQCPECGWPVSDSVDAFKHVEANDDPLTDAARSDAQAAARTLDLIIILALLLAAAFVIGFALLQGVVGNPSRTLDSAIILFVFLCFIAIVRFRHYVGNRAGKDQDKTR